MNQLLSRSAELEERLLSFFSVELKSGEDRMTVSRIMCSVSFEHAESLKMLLVANNCTSALGLLRLQYEALVRGMWIMYAANDNTVAKLSAELTNESARRAANSMPMLSEMLTKLEGKAPEEAMKLLLEFKEYSWKPLSSFVHGGIHAVHRHSTGYPVAFLQQLIKVSNGVSLMVAMVLVILINDRSQSGKVAALQQEFADCLPPIL